MRRKRIIKILSTISLLSVLFAGSTVTIMAACDPRDRGCVDDPFGTINNPLNYGTGPAGTGLLIIFNNVLRLFFAAAGVFAFIKILMAGFGFLNAGGDPKKIESAWASIWQSLLGLAIIASSFAIAGLIGQIIFGDWRAILQPTLYGV